MFIAPERRRARGWVVPFFAVAVGAAVAATLVMRGDTKNGMMALAVLVGYGLLLGYRRSDAHDGRTAGNTRAAAVTGDVLLGVIVAVVVAQALRGADVTMFAALAGVGCLTYLVAAVVLSDY